MLSISAEMVGFIIIINMRVIAVFIQGVHAKMLLDFGDFRPISSLIFIYKMEILNCDQAYDQFS